MRIIFPPFLFQGYADEEDRHHHAHETEGHNGGNHQKQKRGYITPEIHDLVEDNLAADFDGSLSGLGVDIHTSSFSMSEALNALPNLSISSSQIFKQEVPSPTHGQYQSGGNHSGGVNVGYDDLKNEPISRTSSTIRTEEENKKNMGALDLSNDEAHLPDSNEGAVQVVTSFAGSISRESTPSQLTSFAQHLNRMKPSTVTKESSHHVANVSVAYNPNLSASNPNLSTGGNVDLASTSAAASLKSHKVILPLQQDQGPGGPSQDNMKLEKRSYESIAINEIERSATNTSQASNFQYILAASTSIATKLNEPSITYLNQGQPYELRMKKLGDLSSYRKRLLKCVLRICFHERRLQYMESEQIAEWSSKHPGERIIDVDLPLSYGVFETVKDPKSINTLAFKWDPTRDTGIYIKVNCISTEFTPKKHGGEKGVPFRLQVETYDSESRIHAAGCILQVFKLKGADRKHKQDRDKISKRPLAEQEKFAPSYESTVLIDLPLEHIYVPANLSRSGTPIHVESTPSTSSGLASNAIIGQDVVTNSHHQSLQSVVAQYQRGTSAEVTEPDRDTSKSGNGNASAAGLEGTPMDVSASVSQVSLWMMANRFPNHLAQFCNFNGRDMLRLSREELITMCGTSDGIRMFNNLHLVPVLPKATFYVGNKDGDNEFSALFLEELTVTELMKRLGEAFNIDLNLFSKAFFVGPRGILVRMTDRVVKNFKADTVFQFILRSPTSATSNAQNTPNTPNSEAVGGYEVVFEEMATIQLSDNSNNSPASNSNS